MFRFVLRTDQNQTDSHLFILIMFHRCLAPHYTVSNELLDVSTLLLRLYITKAINPHNVSHLRITSLFFSIYIQSICKSRPWGEIRELAKGGNKNLLFSDLIFSG